MLRMLSALQPRADDEPLHNSHHIWDSPTWAMESRLLKRFDSFKYSVQLLNTYEMFSAFVMPLLLQLAIYIDLSKRDWFHFQMIQFSASTTEERLLAQALPSCQHIKLSNCLQLVFHYGVFASFNITGASRTHLSPVAGICATPRDQCAVRLHGSEGTLRRVDADDACELRRGRMNWRPRIMLDWLVVSTHFASKHQTN